jgi:23S rRNA pseudouridine2605 synthase
MGAPPDARDLQAVPMRLAKYLAHSGVASRRHAERLIAAGRVSVGGERVTDPARNVTELDDIRVDGKRARTEELEYWMVNKPLGVVSTAHDPEGRRKVTQLVRSRARLYPVGRLDVDSRGLIILTNDGELANRLMHPRYEVDKTYRAKVDGRVDEEALERLRAGVQLDEGRTAPAEVEAVSRGRRSTTLDITIHEGRKRQVRRMCEAVGHSVVELERTRYGPLGLEDLSRGAARRLLPEEVEALKRGRPSASKARR